MLVMNGDIQIQWYIRTVKCQHVELPRKKTQILGLKIYWGRNCLQNNA